MILVKQLSANSFIMSNSKTSKSLGLVNLKEDGFHLLGNKTVFKSLDDIASHFGGNIEELSNEESAPQITEIEGIPVKHGSACDMQDFVVGEKSLKVYKTKVGSNILFAAGYFGLKFKNGYVATFCPKLKTLQENDFIGYYTNEMDLNFHLKKINKGESIE